MEIVTVSPVEFVAIAGKTTAAERLASMLDDRGIIHNGRLYVVAKGSAAEDVEAALRAIPDIGPPKAGSDAT
jgi:hypothetical protein